MSARMPNGLSQKDFELFRAHLAKFPRALVCPVCDSRTWDLAGIHSGMPIYLYGKQALQNLSTPMLPVASAVCSNCGLVRQFAWIFATGEAQKLVKEQGG